MRITFDAVHKVVLGLPRKLTTGSGQDFLVSDLRFTDRDGASMGEITLYHDDVAGMHFVTSSSDYAYDTYRTPAEIAVRNEEMREDIDANPVQA